MRSNIQISVPPAERDNSELHRDLIAKHLQIPAAQIAKIDLLKRSIDARRGQPKFNLTFAVWIGEVPAKTDAAPALKLQNVAGAKEVLVVGCGPAGMFAALKLIESGLKPVILERGKQVQPRRRDLAAITKQGIVNPDSNYCFGEGGAGTFSDGKLYTRSTKRGSVERILGIFVQFGAERDILIDAHPHIGTNKLPGIVQEMRQAILDCGGEIRFSTRVTELVQSGKAVTGVRTSDGTVFKSDALILATGHSARDIFYMLQAADVLIEAKPFALGVRVEHPQSFVDSVQYRNPVRPPELPAASYALRHQSRNRGVFSFCMCPGGIICPAATSGDEIVVNGWSPSKRNSYFANSGIVVEVAEEDLQKFGGDKTTAGLRFQQAIERRAAEAGGGMQVAPAQRLTDFIAKTASTTVPESSYIPGLQPGNLDEVLPGSIAGRLREAFVQFGRQLKGFTTEDAVVVAVESRTSSPIRIPRDHGSLMHPGLNGLFPCGEGAGYAGGIVSAAMDGERSALAAAAFQQRRHRV